MNKQHILLYNEAQKLHQRGLLDKALPVYDRILELCPNFGQARIGRSLIWQRLGRVHDAVKEAQHGMDDIKKPTAGDWSNFGVVCKSAGLLEDALQAYEKAGKLQPNLISVKINMASLQLVLGRVEAAEKLCRELVSKTEEAAPWLNLARIALHRKDHEQFSDCLRHVEDLDPKNPEIPLLRALAAADVRDEKTAALEALKTLKLSPARPEAWNLLLGFSPASIDLDALEQALHDLAAARTQMPTLLASAVDLARHHLIWGPLPELERQLAQLLDKPQTLPLTVTACFSLLGCNVPQSAHKFAAEVVWKKNFSRKAMPSRELPPLSECEPLRVGFLSSDLRGHAIGFLIVGLLEKLPRGRVTWYSYNNSFSDNSAARARLRAGFDRFINVASLDGAELAQRIRDDRIDVLIDLNGMTRDTRAGMLSFRAAPVQVTWLGMPGTLGAPEDVDYIIGDAWTTPLSLAEGFSEKIIQLPRSYQPNDHAAPDLSLAGTRADHRLPEDAVVYCCFNQHYKISPDTFALWGRILTQVPSAVLWLMGPATQGQLDRLRSHAKANGIAPERLVFAKSVPQPQHIARISLADLVLDTLPYNAHTTCSDALRAGVPVLTLPGTTFAGRVAAGILDTAGLQGWIAEDADAYVRKAVEYGQMPAEERKLLRQSVHDTYWQSPMVDNEGFGTLLEQLCLKLYERHAAGLGAAHLRLTWDGALESIEGDSQKSAAPNIFKTAAAKPSAIAAATPKPHMDMADIALPVAWQPLIVDIGAAAFDGRQPWDGLIESGAARGLSFEPSPEAYAQLDSHNKKHVQLVNAAVGDGKGHTLHLCHAPGMNSLLEPDASYLSMFPGFSQWGTVTSTMPLNASAPLDSVPEARDAAMLKIDTQGFELTILRHATAVLERVVLLWLELSPTPLYHGEASMFEVGHWLQEHGWTLHSFANLNHRRLKPLADDNAPFEPGKRLLQADAVFLPDIRCWHELSDIRLGELAFLAHEVLHDHDCAARALMFLDERDGGKRLQTYRGLLDGK